MKNYIQKVIVFSIEKWKADEFAVLSYCRTILIRGKNFFLNCLI